MWKPLSALLLCGLLLGFTPQQTALLAGGVPNWVPNRANPPDIAINWQQRIAWKKGSGLVSIASLGVTVTRSNAETNLLPTSPSGFVYTSFAASTLAYNAQGRQSYEARANAFLNSTVPVTQSPSLNSAVTYTLWVNGSGSATMSNGTATSCGTSTATQSNPISFTPATAGTCTVTISGSLNTLQLEANPGSVSAPTPFIVTTGSPILRQADNISMALHAGSAFTLFELSYPQMPTTYGTGQIEIEANDGTTTNRANLQRQSATGFGVAGNAGFATIVSQAVNGVVSASTALPQYTAGKLAASFTASGTMSKLNFGSREDATLFFNGTVAIDAIWLNQAVPLTQLLAMTR